MCQRYGVFCVNRRDRVEEVSCEGEHRQPRVDVEGKRGAKVAYPEDHARWKEETPCAYLHTDMYPEDRVLLTCQYTR